MNIWKKFKENESNAFSSRIHEIDFFRGILIILVIFDHLMWFINFYIFHRTNPFLSWYWTSTLRTTVRQVVLMLFLFACGISCFLSKNNKKRGFLLLLLALIVTISTHIIQLLPMFNNRVVVIDINVLGVIALSILLFSIFEKRSNKDVLLVTGGLMLFFFFILLSKRVEPDIEYNAFRSVLYCSFNPIKEGYVGDYLSLFPYVIALFLGVLFARRFYSSKKTIIKKKGNWEKPICFLGRHTLIIYIAHEVIFTIIFMVIEKIIY